MYTCVNLCPVFVLLIIDIQRLYLYVCVWMKMLLVFELIFFNSERQQNDFAEIIYTKDKLFIFTAERLQNSALHNS